MVVGYVSDEVTAEEMLRVISFSSSRKYLSTISGLFFMRVLLLLREVCRILHIKSRARL